MNRVIALLLAIIPMASMGATTVTETPGTTVTCIRGSTNWKTLPSYEECLKAAIADAATRKPGDYVYKSQDAQDKISVKVTKDPVIPPVTWTFCAEEGQTCTTNKTITWRYGAGASFVTGDFPAGPRKCENAAFISPALPSGDPIVNVPKICYTNDASAIVVPPPVIIPPTDPDPGMPATPGTGPIAATWRGEAFSNLRIGPANTADPSQRPAPATDGTGAFRNPCGYSHMAFDDPIVFPGQSGASHLHTFFGNSRTDASGVKDAPSTCAGGVANMSAYWVPALIDTTTNKAMVPFGNLVYYKNGYNQIPNASVRTPPKDLRFIGGNLPTNTGPVPDEWAHHVITCNGDYATHSQSIPPCAPGGFIEISIGFPNCWDGVNLDSPNHRSHMVYAGGGSCPTSHPVAIPTVALNMKYAIEAGQDVSKWRLSSDNYNGPGGYSMHGDLWFNWQPDIADTWMTYCVRATMDCHGFLLGDGRITY